MEKKYVKIFKCRGCNRDIIKNDVDLSIAEKWTLSGMFQDGCKPVEVSGGSRLSGQNKFLLHRCDPEKLCIQPHETVKVHTGLRMAPPEGWYVAIYARSGLATKLGLAPANKIGVCDQDYRGEYIVALHNHSNISQMITHGDRIAQMAVVPFWQADFEEVSELDETERGAGGFGSTGKQ